MVNPTDFTQEGMRLKQEHPNSPVFPWYKWGPYVSERAWATVREDYSRTGDAWRYCSYDMAKAKTFRWGEDGIAGLCDRFQILVLSFAFWNGKDRELKERLFGLNPSEANHGEDVKEYYYYLDNTPTHSYMKYLYKYPQARFPYEDLIRENNKRDKIDREYELLDTAVFKENKYFDVFIEYSKNTPEDICICVEVFNRGAEPASFHLLPQLVFRKHFNSEDTSTSTIELHKQADVSALVCKDLRKDSQQIVGFEYLLGDRYFYGQMQGQPLFTNNESNEKLLVGKNNSSPYVKDAFHHYVIHKNASVINPANKGTKGALHYEVIIEPHGSRKFLFRLSDKELKNPLQDVEKIVEIRKQEADAFYEALHPKLATQDEKAIQRQALSGLLWNKQFYFFDVSRWLKGDEGQIVPVGREDIRNKHWKHLLSMRIMAMPDKWEYPWFAAWDLAFHTISFALIDLNFAKEQLWLLLFDQFQHPNGQIPAYEWEFSEMNPPVQGWAVLRLYHIEHEKTGKKDKAFLKKCFHKLMLNFTWWVNKVDASGNNVFEGGFLGLDNITVIDRSAGVPGGGKLEQSDGTGWMGMFCLSLMRMALELAQDDGAYEVMATKFFEHYVYIAAALHCCSSREVQIWNDKEGFFYDVLSFPNGMHQQIFVRSLIGVIPTYAMDAITEEELKKLPEFSKNFHWFFKHRKDLVDSCITPIENNGNKKYLLSLMNLTQLKRVLEKVWDPSEFRSEYGLRSLSKMYEKNPYVFLGHSISYEPAEAISTLKGGNSNWRGPIWTPMTFLLIDSLKKLHLEVGDLFSIESHGSKVNAGQMAEYFATALVKIFTKDSQGRRPMFGDYEMLQTDPHWKDHLLFYEHFHGDTGRGLGASHQTGWTALIANIIDEWKK
ncbi:MAG: glucosidase [Chlamydiota bacterium]